MVGNETRRSVRITVRARMTWRPAMFLVAILTLCGQAMLAQTSQGALTGTVVDGKGAMVRHSSVAVTKNDTQTTVTTLTNNVGVYNVGSLNPGEYTIKVSSSGFATAIFNDVTISTAQTTTLNAQLNVGTASESITVQAQGASLSAGTPDVSTTVDHTIVENLPYPERSSLEAVLLVPGVNGDSSWPGGIMSENPVITTGPVVPGASLSLAGAPPGSSSILVDGSDVLQSSYPRTGINLSGQIVQEMTVIVSGLSAKYGRTGGGVVVQSSKGGTNDYHGRVSWRHTDPFFNAFPLGTTARNAQHENFYGFYLGGPIRIPKLYNGRDKTFFFVGIEPARLDNTLSYRGSFLTPADLAGQLHNNLAFLNQTILKTSGYAAAVAAPRIGGVYYSTTVNAQGFPYGPTGSGPSREVTGPGGLDDVSPELAQNPFAKYVLSLLPTPSHPGPYVTFDNPSGTYETDGTNASYRRGVMDIDNRYSIRVDHQFNSNNRIFARYTNVPVSGPRFFALAPSNPLVASPDDIIVSQDVALGYTHVFTNSFVNNFRYSFMRANEQRTPPPSSLTMDFGAKYGLTPATLGKGFPQLGVLGASGTTLNLASTTPYGDIDQNFIAGDDITWAKGKHVMQIGGDFRWLQSTQTDTSQLYGGKYAFNATQTSTTGVGGGNGGSSLASFIMGSINSYTAAPVSVPGYYRWRYGSLYFQDDWKILPTVTLNLGVRYEVEEPRREKFNNQAMIQLNYLGTVNGQAVNTAFCFSSVCGLGTSLWPTNWKGVEPRIGISIAPTVRTTLRASYGITRLPLTGYENTPDPNFNIASTAVSSTVGGATQNSLVNYITNPVGPLTSAFTQLGGARGPIYSSLGFNPVYVQQADSVPYMQNYSATIQYQPLRRTLLQATYQGLKGTHLIGSFAGSLNIPTLPTLIAAIQGHAYLSQNTPNTLGIVQNGAVTTESGLQKLNPYQNFFNQSIPEIYPRRGTSEYNAFYATLNQQYGSGLALLVSYSWSKAMDNVPDVTGGTSADYGTTPPQDPRNTFGEWAVTTFDQPSKFRAGYVYQLPFGAGRRFTTHHSWVNQIIGNFSTSGIVSVLSGFPSSVTLGNTGYFSSFTPKGTLGCTATNFCASAALPTGYTLRPNIVPGQRLINSGWKSNPFGLNGAGYTPYLNAAAFAIPGSINNPALGNAPRTLTDARSPRETMFDARVMKGFTIKSRYTLNLTGTFNNAFNHPVYLGTSTTTLNTTSETNVVSGTTPSITFTPNITSFGKLNPNTALLSRVIRVGAEFVF
jgi:hypothetical protein